MLRPARAERRIGTIKNNMRTNVTTPGANPPNAIGAMLMIHAGCPVPGSGSSTPWPRSERGMGSAVESGDLKFSTDPELEAKVVNVGSSSSRLGATTTVKRVQEPLATRWVSRRYSITRDGCLELRPA